MAFSASDAYTLTETLVGHKKLVLCMAATEDGRLLASGGGDGTIVWDLEKMNLKQRLSTLGTRGATTALLWIRREDTLEEGLVIGTHAGHVVLCRITEETVIEIQCLQLSQPSEITSIQYDSATNKLLVANRLGTVALFGIDPNSMEVLRDHWAKWITHSIPRSAGFSAKGEIVIFGLHDSVYVWDMARGDHIKEPKSHGILIGDVQWDAAKHVYVVDTVLEGAALYRSSDHAKIQEYNVPRKMKEAFPKHVTFAEADKLVVSGSDHGGVYVFEKRTGALLQALFTESNCWLQSVASTNINGSPAIFAAQAIPEEVDNKIFVFKRAGMRQKTTSMLGRVLIGVKLTFQLFVWVGAVTAVYQNVPWEDARALSSR